jgi:hypothetical protein
METKSHMTESRKLICKTQHEILVAYLWRRRDWIATHELQGVNTPYGHIGSAGHTRARELARNECPDKLKNKVERAEGRDIGLDPRFVYFRYRRETTEAEMRRWSHEAITDQSVI